MSMQIKYACDYSRLYLFQQRMDRFEHCVLSTTWGISLDHLCWPMVQSISLGDRCGLLVLAAGPVYGISLGLGVNHLYWPQVQSIVYHWGIALDHLYWPQVRSKVYHWGIALDHLYWPQVQSTAYHWGIALDYLYWPQVRSISLGDRSELLVLATGPVYII